MNRQHNLLFALKDGIPTYIDDVESGLKCNCICPACGEPLVAKKGEKMVHHFAHYAGHNCEYGYESSLHLAAKNILLSAKKITLPAVYVSFPDSYKDNELICDAKEIPVDRVELEKKAGEVIPDVVIYSGNKKLFVEIFVTHSIDAEKLSKLQREDISTIEIDLSKTESTISAEELKEVLLSDNKAKKWKYNALANKHLQNFYRAADKREISLRGFSQQVNNCPITSRVWHGRPYANFIDDCLHCEYCISRTYDNGFLCSGRLRISKIADFKTPNETRIWNSNAQLEKQKEKTLEEGRCPYCGGRLIKRQGNYGVFWGCESYPYCRFTTNKAPQNTGK